MADHGDAFDGKFGRLTAMMLRALERRCDRARERAALLHPTALGRTPTGSEASERERWLELERHYARAHGHVHAAGVFVHHAAVLLRRIRDDSRGTD